MRTYLQTALLASLLLIPAFSHAELLAYPEGEPQPLLVGTASVEDTAADAAYRESLIQLIRVLQMQLAAILEKRAIAVPDTGDRLSFNTGVTVFENEDLYLEVKQTAVQPYTYDGNDLDDDSFQFAVNLEITNKNKQEHLLLDRESLVIKPVDENRRSVSPKRTFNFKTGHTRTTSEYGYEKQDRKVLAIEPGQTATVLLYHSYQFETPGQYRGLIENMRYAIDSVSYNSKTDQFEKRNRVYELPDERDLKTAVFDRSTIMVEAKFVDEDFKDDKYNLTEFAEQEVPFTFLYPDTFSVDEDDESWTISYDGKPYIVVSLDDSPDLPNSAKEAESNVSTLNYERTTKTTYLFTEKDASGSIHEYASLGDTEFTILLYEYADTSESFKSYDVGTVFTSTFTSIR